MNILFVCSRNQWRSPTAEAIYKQRQDLNVRSAGTSPAARIRLGAKLVAWAELIFVMERSHRAQLVRQYGDALEGKDIVVLDIPDDYGFMDPELVEEIRAKVDAVLESRG